MTGNCPPAANPPPIQTVTNSLAAENPGTEPKRALEHRRLKLTSPYNPHAWHQELSRLGLLSKYPRIVDGLKSGFDLSIPQIHNTFIPPNHSSVPLLPEVYTTIVGNEFATGRYIGPFSHAKLEAKLGPFQTSPLSFIPKVSKPGKYRAVHNFSFPHKPLPEASSVNSHIDSKDFPCTWGTFNTVTLLITCLPDGSQASVRDVAEAYRTIPASPSQWPGLVIRLQADDQFAVNTCNNFRLSSAGGVYVTLADAGADIFQGNGIGPVAKWVNDHIFFRIPRTSLPAYNALRAQWNAEIHQNRGRQQIEGRLWYRGNSLPDGSPSEFDEDCGTSFEDLAGESPHAAEDELFSYSDADINVLLEHLGIWWEVSKLVLFRTEVPFLGFLWNLHMHTVCLLEKKRHKYLASITEWQVKRTHNLLETQRLYGKLHHASLVILPGSAHLINLEAMLASLHHSPFLPRTLPQDTPTDLEWWRRRLSQPDIPRPIPEPSPLIDLAVYSDASSGVGITITISERWRAWRLVNDWKSQRRDIQWAEAISFELLVTSLLAISKEGDHILVYGNNRGVVEGWWKKSSANRQTNHVFQRILELSENHCRFIHTRYILSTQNPADTPSRGVFPPAELMLDDFRIPSDLHSLLVSVEPDTINKEGQAKAHDSHTRLYGEQPKNPSS